jgi:hypothetical protein
MGFGMADLSRAGRDRARLQTLLAGALALFAGMAAAAPPGSAGQPFAASRSFWRTDGGQVRPAWFVCSSIDGSDMTVAALPDHGRLTLAQPLARQADVYSLGEPDPGAGQVYWPLSSGGRRLGEIHAFNPGMITDPKAATTPTFTSIRIAGAQWNCRWLERTRLMGFSNRRTVIITQDADGRLEYRSYDFKNAAKLKRIELDDAQQTTTTSLDIKGGRESLRGFQFRRGGFTYEVAAGPTGGTIVVRNNGGTSLREPLIAWTIAPAP